ncbi:MAG: hypothetical protein IIA44_15135 [Acidobacteria bacterium]|nr:hypothetical protein [Acidobacteriota bacterium]
MDATERSTRRPYRIAVRGPVPGNIADLIGQAHAAAILAARKHPGHDLNARKSSVASSPVGKDGQEEEADDGIQVQGL